MFAPSTEHYLTVSLILFSSRKQCMRQVEGPWRALCQLKKPYKGPRQRRGICWEEWKRGLFPWWGVIDLPSRQINDFVQKGNRKNWISGQTYCPTPPMKRLRWSGKSWGQQLTILLARRRLWRLPEPDWKPATEPLSQPAKPPERNQNEAKRTAVRCYHCVIMRVTLCLFVLFARKNY